jgi:hypothetical protein
MEHTQIYVTIQLKHQHTMLGSDYKIGWHRVDKSNHAITSHTRPLIPLFYFLKYYYNFLHTSFKKILKILKILLC